MSDLRTIPGFPDYQAGIDGSIWSERKKKLTRKRPAVARTGYLVTGLVSEDGLRSVCYVHRLVWLTFGGPIPDGQEVCHNNGDRTDNRIENLRTDTRKGNLADRIRHGTMNCGERAGGAKLSSHQVRGIRDLYATGKFSQSILARRYAVSRSAVASIVLRINWRHLP